MITIYKATSPSGKLYIGITNNFSKRKSGHYTKARKGLYTPFAKALNKYGKNIIWEIIKEVDTLEEACILEQELIAKFKTTNRNYGYNITKGGEGSLGRTGWNKGLKLSEEIRHNMSIGKQGIISKPSGWKHTEESKLKMRKPRKPFSEERKLKHSQAIKKSWEKRRNKL